MSEWLLIVVIVISPKNGTDPIVSVATAYATTVSECNKRGREWKSQRKASEIARGYSCTSR